ncbi:MAG: zf-HC2 domain-containing protein [Gemmatimonadota bacterium]
MSGSDGCVAVREFLPEWASGRMPEAERRAVTEHLEKCAACREEAELVRLLYVGRDSVPGALVREISRAVRSRRVRRRRHAWWGLAAAAVAVLALGIGVASYRTSDEEPTLFASEDLPGSVWVTEDGEVAGAPAWDELSDDELEALLQELNG